MRPRTLFSCCPASPPHPPNPIHPPTPQRSFAFNNVAPDDVIELSVYDHNRLMKDSLMGTGSLTLRQVRLGVWCEAGSLGYAWWSMYGG